MYLCKVAGKIVCTIKHPSLGAGSLIFVKPIDSDGAVKKDLMVAFDSIGCGEGDVILVTGGSNARFVHSLREVPIDLAVVGIVDNYELEAVPMDNNAQTQTAIQAKAKPQK